jgi:hypothetical protein
VNASDRAKWYSGFQSSLVAKWAIISTALSTQLGDAFFHGAFNTPASSLQYVHNEWWTILITSVFAVVVGGATRASNKVSYVNQVEAGTKPPPATLPVVSPMTPPLTPTTEPPP